MSGVVYQRRAPDPTGQEADHGGSNHRGDGDGEEQAKAGESKGGESPDTTDATREEGEVEERGRQGTDAHTTHGNQRQSAERRRQPNYSTDGGGRERGGQAGVQPDPGGPLPLGGVQPDPIGPLTPGDL